MKMRGEDTVVAVTLLEKDHLLTISDVGFGKRTEFDDFRGHGRGTTAADASAETQARRLGFALHGRPHGHALEQNHRVLHGPAAEARCRC